MNANSPSPADRGRTRQGRWLTILFVALFVAAMVPGLRAMHRTAKPDQVRAYPPGSLDAENLLPPARELVDFVHSEALPDYWIEMCSSDHLTHQRVIESALPARLRPDSTHRLIEDACVAPSSAATIRPITEHWNYYRVLAP